MRKNMRRPTVTPHRCHDQQRIRKPCMADSDKCRPIIGHDVAPHCRKYTRHPAGKCLELLVLKSWKVKPLSNSSLECFVQVAPSTADQPVARCERLGAAVDLDPLLLVVEQPGEN